MASCTGFSGRILDFLAELEHPVIKKDPDNPKNINADICAQCGGKCCKRCGCHYSPDDFKEVSFDFLKDEIKKGYISIEFIDRDVILQDSGCYILRIRNQGAPIVENPLSREILPCILHTDTGCKLSYEDRPSGGKLLIPRPNGNCRQSYDIDACCHEWRPHQDVLRKLAHYFSGKNFPCLL